MKRADEIVQNMAHTHGQDNLQGADFHGLSSCADSMRRACDVLRVCNQSPTSAPLSHDCLIAESIARDSPGTL